MLSCLLHHRPCTDSTDLTQTALHVRACRTNLDSSAAIENRNQVHRDVAAEESETPLLEQAVHTSQLSMSSAELVHPLQAQGMGAMAGGLQNQVVALKVRSLLSRSLRSHGLGVAALDGDLLFACRKPHPLSWASSRPRSICRLVRGLLVHEDSGRGCRGPVALAVMAGR